MKELIVDVNAWLGAWPYQYFHDDTAARLVGRMETEGVSRALVGSPEAALNPDCLEANRILLRRCKGHAPLMPVLALDPTKGDWRDNLALGADNGVRAFRLFPGYHCYELSSPRAREVVEAVAKAGGPALFVQVRMEDERTHHPLCRIPPVSVESLVELAGRFPTVQVVAACPYYWEAVEIARGPENLCFELSHVETLRTLVSLVKSVPVSRVLFGTHVPFLQSRASLMKLQAPYVPAEVRSAVASGNAERIFGRIPGAKPTARRRPA